MALSFLDSYGLSHLWGKIKSTFATKDVVSKSANGLAPMLPNETATTKFLRQDGSWAVPPSGGGSVTVDSSLSTTSENPVQNKVITNALNTKLTTSGLTLGSADATISLSANGYQWGHITVPNGRTLICPAGYWISGTNNTSCVAYAFYMENSTTIQIAVRTWASSAHSVTVHIYYLYI